ncbi:MAG: HEPN domain-containing protein [Pseudomonadota bacterium]
MTLQVILNSFASEVFRKQADYDYIAARMNYKMRLRQQFLWSGQQAVEKYLKSILLYNGKSARFFDDQGKKKEFGHNLILLNNEVNKISDLNYKLPNWSEEFILYLTELGGFNRYMTEISYSTPDGLHKLDELVWNIRKYCQYIPDRVLGHKNEIPKMKKSMINYINNKSHKDNPNKFKLIGGELEKILELPNQDPARKALVWANLYYGKNNKKIVKYRPMSCMEIPPQHRDWFTVETNKKIISDYVKL